MNARLDGVQRVAGCDKQLAPVFTAKRDICGPWLGNGNEINLLATRIKYRDAFAYQIDVSLIINRHSVRAHVNEDGFAAQRAIGIDTVGVGLVAFDIGDIKPLAVGRPDDAVRLLQVVDDADQLLMIGRQIVDILARLFHGASGPVIPLIKRICNVDAAIGTHPNIIRPIQQLAIISFHQYRDLAGRRDLP